MQTMTKAKQRADVDHLADVVDGGDAADDRGEQAGEDGGLPGGAEAWVDGAEEAFAAAGRPWPWRRARGSGRAA